MLYWDGEHPPGKAGTAIKRSKKQAEREAELSASLAAGERHRLQDAAKAACGRISYEVFSVVWAHLRSEIRNSQMSHKCTQKICALENDTQFVLDDQAQDSVVIIANDADLVSHGVKELFMNWKLGKLEARLVQYEKLKALASEIMIKEQNSMPDKRPRVLPKMLEAAMVAGDVSRGARVHPAFDPIICTAR
jgi:hypothetical protein